MYIQEAAKVDKATEPLTGISAQKAMEILLGSGQHGIKPEACSDYTRTLIGTPGYHAFFHTCEKAFNEHRSLAFSPDMFWLLVAQGLAQHINNHAEKLRHRFVEHTGKKEIKVRRDDFVKGSPENPWEEVFPVFSQTQSYITFWKA